MQDRTKKYLKKCIWFLSILILVLYPLRHVHMGVDLWDTGYNYANFRYMGTEYMDSMWLFATYLANVLGAIFIRLPFGNTVMGMNVYTGLVVSGIAVFGYIFCVKKLKMPAWIVFAGEMLAVSLCWAPTAMLYTYLTYGFFLVGTAFLYRGITEEKNSCLVIAGILLGLNVGVRFSNLVQAGLIVAVWGYGIFCKKKFSEVMKETGFCVLGYVGAFGLFLLFVSVRYGFGNYIEGIGRLFQMTEVATDYTAGAMLEGMVWAYFDSAYWLKRFVLMAVCGVAIFLVLPRKWKPVKQVFSVGMVFALVWWLLQKGFCTKDYASYTSMNYPCVIVLVMTIGLVVFQLCIRKTSREEKLLAGLVLLTLLISPLGGNNAMYSSINNLFLVAPWFLFTVWKFCREMQQEYFFPVKCMLLVAVVFFVVQSAKFGTVFAYEEANGGRHMVDEVADVPALQGMFTRAEKAEWIEETYRFIQEQGLGDQECIFYGQIPGMAYYMELTPAMNTWGDLRSYSSKTMHKDLQEVEAEMQERGQRPLVMLEASHGLYQQGQMGAELFWDKTAEQKLKLLCDFMEKYDYELIFSNEKFAIYK